MKKILYALMPALALAACIKKDAPVPPVQAETRSVSVLLSNNYAFSMFNSALKRAGIDSMTTGETPYTWLIPDNEAFGRAGVSADSLERIPVAELKRWLLYHILPGKVRGVDMPQALVFPMTTMEGTQVYTSTPLPGQSSLPIQPGRVYIHVNGVNVDKADLPAGNGHMHVLNKPLRLPLPTVKDVLESQPQFSRFTAALKKFGLLDQLAGRGPVTVLAIPNERMDAYGLDEATMDQISPATHQRFLFSSYILKDLMFFVSDLDDARPGGDAAFFPGRVLLDDVMFYLDGGGMRVLHKQFDEGYPYEVNYGFGYANFMYQRGDQLALNGVLHALDKPMVSATDALIQ